MSDKSDVLRALIDALLPPGPLWNVEQDGDLDKLFDGMADNSAVVYEFLLQLAKITNPAESPFSLLPDLEKEFGILTNLNSTEAERRAQVASIKYSRGGNGGKDFLEDSLQTGGFDVLVHENDPPVDPAPLVNGNPSSVVDYVLAGIRDSVPATLTSEDFSLVFFVGGPAVRDGVTNELLSISFATIPLDSLNVFNKIVKRIMPVHSWAVFKIIASKANYFGFDEDPDALSFGDVSDPTTGGLLATII
jgi:hypothetical protein